tara:strand:+ start:607 stop:840 length:234 start_codon:yes stop_codon:yes gene_type:complete
LNRRGFCYGDKLQHQQGISCSTATAQAGDKLQHSTNGTQKTPALQLFKTRKRILPGYFIAAFNMILLMIYFQLLTEL